MRLIDKIIYLYFFICVCLLLFNLFYIMRSEREKKKTRERIERWKRELADAAAKVREGEVPQAHLGRLEKRLSQIHELTAYNQALFSEEPPMTEEELALYFKICRPTFLNLAWKYQKRGPMERAAFAYMIAVFYQKGEPVQDRMPEVLLSYLEDSTVYCRENVLHGLYVLGNASAVGQAFDYISKMGWYHHPRLISDGMQEFRGDREELIRRLWNRRSALEESLVVGIVQFATNTSDVFGEEFGRALEDEREPMEVRLALLRYFRRYPRKQIYPLLLAFLGGKETAAEFAIVAAFALAAYPGEETKAALKQALHSHNWYVRRNAAFSLKHLGITREDREEIASSGDCYANEILSYMAERESA